MLYRNYLSTEDIFTPEKSKSELLRDERVKRVRERIVHTIENCCRCVVSAFPTASLFEGPETVQKRTEALPLPSPTVSFNDYRNEDLILAALKC